MVALIYSHISFEFDQTKIFFVQISNKRHRFFAITDKRDYIY
jgi:hypothetical protein